MEALQRTAPDFRLLTTRLRHAVENTELRPWKGRVVDVTGTLVRATAPGMRIGEICLLRDPDGIFETPAEVVGLSGDVVLLTPIGEVAGLSARTEVIRSSRGLAVPVGPELLGRLVDGMGRALDRSVAGALVTSTRYPAYRLPPSPLERRSARTPLPVGIRAIDGLLTCGEGQRIGIYGPAGVGKSRLLDQIIDSAKADILVMAVIGERGREVREFVERHVERDTKDRTVVVAATSDRPAKERVMAAHTATAIAEYFRDQGNRVLLLMDSVTRYVRALRDIGLASGEPPIRRGFPPSVFDALPRLFERAGATGVGAITGIYSVLVDGDADTDPIAEETRALLDGHIILSTELANGGHYPAIDVLRSRSRLMDSLVEDDHKAAAIQVRRLLARHAEVELLLQVGEYRQGGDSLADRAIERIDDIKAFLRQQSNEPSGYEETVAALRNLAT